MAKNEKEISEALTYIEGNFLASIHTAEIYLGYFDNFRDEIICQLFNPETSLEALKKYSLIDLKLSVQYRKRHITMMHKFCIGAYQQIFPFKNLETCYDLLIQLKLNILYMRDDIKFQQYFFGGDLPKEKFEKVQGDYYRTDTDIIHFLEENILAIEPLMENNQKTYWKNVKVDCNWDTGKPEPFTITKISDFSQKVNKVLIGLHHRVNSEKRTETRQSVESTLKKVSEENNKMISLSMQRLALQGVGKPIQRESTKACFFSLYDSLEQLMLIGKEYDKELKDIEECLKLKDESDKLRAYQLSQKNKRDDYKKMLNCEKEKRASQRKVIIKHIKAIANSMTLKTAQQVRQALENCNSEEVDVFHQVLKNANTIKEKTIDVLLPKLGFSIKKIGDQGHKFSIGQFSVTYHTKHAADPEAGILHQDFITELRKIFWNLGFNQKLLETLSRSLLQKKDTLQVKHNSSAHTSLGKPKMSLETAKAAQTSSDLKLNMDDNLGSVSGSGSKLKKKKNSIKAIRTSTNR